MPDASEGNLRFADSPFLSEFYELAEGFVVFAVFAVFGDEWLVGVGSGIFEIDDSGGDHLYQREAFA